MALVTYVPGSSPVVEPGELAVTEPSFEPDRVFGQFHYISPYWYRVVNGRYMPATLGEMDVIKAGGLC